MLVEDIPQEAPGSNRLPPLPGEADSDQVLTRRLRALREAGGLTQRQLAEQVTAAGYRMHQTTIAKIEAGERPVIVGEAVALARVIGVDLADLITEPGEGEGELAEALAELGGCQRNVEALETRRLNAAVVLQEVEAALDAARTQLEAARWRAEIVRRRASGGK